MREFCFTLYRNAQDTHGKPVKQTWDRWADLLSQHQIRGAPTDTENKLLLDKNKNGPAIVLGDIPAGKSRRAAHVRSIHALALDIDGVAQSRVEAALAALEPFEWVVWTTHKHGSVAAGPSPRLRIVIPLADPISPSDHPSAWAGLNYLAGGVNDPKTRDLARLHFLPSTFDASVAWAIRHPGRFLALGDLPDVEQEPPAPAREWTPQDEIVNRIRSKIKALPKSHELKAQITQLANGESFAEEGERHTTVLSLTMWLAMQDRTLTRDSLSRLFGPSLEVMGIASPTAPTVDEVFQAYEGAIQKLNQLDLEREKETAEREKVFQLENAGSQEPYTPEEMERIATVNGWTPDELAQRWIVQKDGSGWFLTESGDYVGPYSKDDVVMASSRFLSRAPIRLVEATRSGFKYRTFQDVSREAGSLADKVVSDMTLARSFYDPKARVMHEAILPLRKDLKPAYDQELDKWLQVLGGPLYPKLLDWLCCAWDLDKLLCAIYFDGPKGSGKTMFAHGLAKLWTGGPPAEIESAISDFNDEITRCPVVLADEEIPHKKYKTVTTVLRSMLSTTSRTLKRKYMPTSEVRGAVRLILTANNEFLLDSRDVSSSQDLDAIAQRFLYVPVSQESTEYLESLPRATRQRWWTKGIAEFCLWLKENHKVMEPGKRFWVEGDISQMHRLLMTGSRWNSLICEFLVRYLMKPEPFDALGNGLIKIWEKELLVNDQALLDGWDLYLKTKEMPETAKIGAALRAVSKSTRRKQLRIGGRQFRYRVIDVEHLISWADRFNIGDQETMLARLEGKEDVEDHGNLVKFPWEKKAEAQDVEPDEESGK